MKNTARLDAARLATLVDELSGLAGAGAVELVNTISQLERLKNAAAAAQARAAVELRDIREAEARHTGRNVRRVAASVAGEIGLARRESPHRASVLLGLAGVLAELPHTRAAFNTGEISEWRVTLIVRETACLSKADRLVVDAELGPKLGGMSTRQICAETRAAAYRLDPHSVVARIGNAVKDRHVSIRPAPDCMTYLSALLPAAHGVAAFAALTKASDAARAAGDERSKGQIMADTIVARITGDKAAGETDVEIQLVITDEALLDDSDTPARLASYGPIPASVARRLAVDAISSDHAWIRRLYAAPGSGRLVAMESARRRFPASMKTFIETRDESCRTPWCGAPIRHTDHVTPVRAGGKPASTTAKGYANNATTSKNTPAGNTQPAQTAQ